MKLKKIEFNKHEILNDLQVNFCDADGNPLNTVVVLGENGAGKTTLLRSIFEFLDADRLDLKSNNSITWIENKRGILDLDVTIDKHETNFKVVYMPAEINFDNLKKVDNTFKFSSNFLNIVDQNITGNIPSFIATKINKEIFKNRDKTIGEAIDKVCFEINSIFKVMDLDVKLIGLTEDENTTPIFQNSFGKKFDINGLSSGEKQLFLRALSLKFLDVNNSIILVDEPEISLHPSWQQKIIKVYENIGENNQLIIATHSPHIVSDIKAEQLRIMKKGTNGVFIVENEGK